MCSRASLLRSATLAAVLALAACSGAGGSDLSELDNELAGNEIDPALTSALEDQILVDPDLVQQAHPNTVRPPEMPVQAQYPAGMELAAAEAPCGSLEPGPQWAERLPAAFPAYPGSRVTDAAGADSGCRIVFFQTGDPYERVLRFYQNAAARAGFSAHIHQRGTDLVLGGVNARTDGAFVLVVTPLEGGSEVSLIVN